MSVDGPTLVFLYDWRGDDDRVLRVVIGPTNCASFEERDGEDALGVVRWTPVDFDAPGMGISEWAEVVALAVARGERSEVGRVVYESPPVTRVEIKRQMGETCPPLERARELAYDWAASGEPHPELLVWVSVFMVERWSGEAIGSLLTTGMEMAWHVGLMLQVLSDVCPAGSDGVIPLCEAAGWPENPGPDDAPMEPQS